MKGVKLSESYLQSTVLVSSEELHEAVDDSRSGDDLVYGRVRLCDRTGDIAFIHNLIQQKPLQHYYREKTVVFLHHLSLMVQFYGPIHHERYGKQK